MWQLPVEELYMAGKSSVNTLHKLGIYNIGQLATSPEYILEAHLKKHGKILWEYANGIDKSVVNTKREELKGVGNSITLPYDLDNMEEIEKILLQLSEKVAGRLRKGKQMAKTVAVEVKYNDFIKASRQTTLDRCTDSGTEIYQLSKELFRELWEKDGNKSVRLLGITGSLRTNVHNGHNGANYKQTTKRHNQHIQRKNEKTGQGTRCHQKQIRRGQNKKSKPVS